MTPQLIRSRVISERSAWIRDMLEKLKGLPLESFESFISDRRNTASAESYLRRALEALLDLGRHILAKGFGLAVTEYKEIAQRLTEQGILSADNGRLLEKMAGYRNRMVHFYQEISNQELYEICSNQLGDVGTVLKELLQWVNDHPEKIDHSL
jgi:uncharacterized protein YutE (UPF0331/DUF86 family)